MKPRKTGQDSAQDANKAPVVTALAATFPIIRFPSPATSAASKGRKTMSWIMRNVPRRRPGPSFDGGTGSRPSPGHTKYASRSALHLIDVVDRDRAAVAEIDDEDRKPDRRFRRGDGQDEHREDLADHVAEESGKGDEVDVHRKQDELDRHQD